MEGIRLNGRPLAAVKVPVNPALDRDATKAYLDLRKDGLDSLGIEIKGRHEVLVGKGFPAAREGDRLEIGADAARILYQEQEVNDFLEGFSSKARGSFGAAYLLGGFAVGAAAAYLGTLLGFLTLPILVSMFLCGVSAAVLGVGLLGVIGGLKASRLPVDLGVTDRLGDQPAK